MRSQPPLFSTRSRTRLCISERFLTIFRSSATSIPTFGRSSVFHFLCKDCDWTLVLILKVYYWIVMSASLDQVRSHAPQLGMWGRIFARHLLCKKRWISRVFLNDVELSSCGVSGCLVVCILCSQYCFSRWNVAISFSWKGTARNNGVQIRHTSRPVCYVLAFASIFNKARVSYIITIIYYFSFLFHVDLWCTEGKRTA